MSHELRQIIYTSTAASAIDDGMLLKLQAQCAQNNDPTGVTGFLLIHRDHFLQLLEGPSDGVAMIYAKIEADDRHTDVNLFSDIAITERAAPSWSMGVFQLDDDGEGDHPLVRLLETCLDWNALDPKAGEAVRAQLETRAAA
ncbi:MAG: BLUF domain-containing protein [Planctomycetota bacterium]